jgi:penicillin amidase
MARLFRILIVLVVSLAVLLGTAAAGGWWFARRSLPGLQAEVIAAVGAPVTVYRDAYGVPHIHAASLEDALFVQGYLHAQDRLFQMDLSRRAASGRLAEIFGADFIDADRFLRAVGMLRAARETEAGLSPEHRNALAAYAAGVNAFLAAHRGSLPLEFTLLGYSPDPWQPVESLAIGKYMAWDLGRNMTTEIFFWRLAERVGPEKAATLFPNYPEDGPAIVARLRGLPLDAGLAGGLARLQETVAKASLAGSDRALGSNNWVVAGAKTASGLPILANDMHLGMGAPSIWYQNHLAVAGRFEVTGVIFPGVPGVIVGHNGHIAWGVTNVGADVQDLYLERRHPDDPARFEYQGEWYQAVVERHEIRVKGQAEPVPFDVYLTRHGPLVSEVVDGLTVPASLRWTAHGPTGELAAVLALAEARDWDSFRKALATFLAPAQNFVYADREGNIGYRANGLFPIRRAGDGLLPVPGWDDRYEWVGFVPMDEVPQIYNPAEGFIVTANHRVAGPDYPYFLSHQWAPPYRAQAIIEALEGRRGLTLEDMIPIQNSAVNLQARRLGPILLRGLAGANLDAPEQAAREELERWLEDPRDHADAAGPALFHALYLEMLEAAFLDDLGEDLYASFVRHGDAINTFDRMLGEGGSPWFGPADQLVRTGFDVAVADLRAAMGDDPARWTWGQIHTVSFEHPLGRQRPLDLIFNRGPFPLGGSHVTPIATAFSLLRPFRVTSAAPWRFLIDLSDLRGLDVAAIGVSGHPLSAHYDDQMALWLEGGYKPLLFGDQVREGSAATTVFRPR